MHTTNEKKINQHQSLSKIPVLLIVLLIFTSSPSHAANNPTSEQSDPDLKTIVVTLKPIYSLVAHLTKGISTPVLLSSNMQSPHHHNLRPSERRLLDKADMIIWIGAPMEPYLEKIIQQQSSLSLPLIQTENLKLLNKRSKHAHKSKHHQALTINKIDPHIWLSTSNVKKISRDISARLVSFDTKNTERYKKNLGNLLSKIDKTDNEIRNILRNNHQPYIVEHDALQYFEKEYNLNYVASINSGDDTSTSAKHLTRINSLIKKHNIQCIFHQPPKSDIVEALTYNRKISAIELDPLGIKLKATDNYDSWFVIMKNLANKFHQCLSH